MNACPFLSLLPLSLSMHIWTYLVVQFSCSVMSDSLRPHEPQHARPPCPSPTLGIHPNPCPLGQWCHPTISSSVVPTPQLYLQYIEHTWHMVDIQQTLVILPQELIITMESESEVTQSCPTLWDSMDCSPPGASVLGIFQAWILEWVAISFSNHNGGDYKFKRTWKVHS